MALDVNGYNASFNAFIKFAQDNITTNKKAVARFGEGPVALGGRAITAAAPDADWVGKFRDQTQKNLNNEIRTAFRNAVIDMFGGERNIPDSVKDAMLLKDYDRGKPLTARRILAVKAAIDRDGTVKRSLDKMLGTFSTQEAENFAKAKGWSSVELPKIARAARFLSAATGLDELTSIAQLSTPGSKENRLLNYGGRFLESAANFKEGLRLMDGFGEWFKGLSAQDGADTPTRINANKGVIKDDCRAGLERIVFDFIANNDKIDITSHDNEAVFGMKNNAASRFVGMMMHTSCLSTFMNIPPQERNVVLAVFSQLTEIADSRQDVKGAESRSLLSGNASPVLRRAIWHMDELAALHNKGQLTAKNIIKTCFPDMPKPAVYNGAAINRFLDSLDSEVLRRFPDDTTGKLAQAANALAFSGLPLKDILDAIDSGKPIPMPKYSSSGEMALSDITNTTQGVRGSLAGDLIRPSGYEKDGQPLTFGIEGFGFSFPGKARVFTNAANGKDNIKAVLDNIESFCGKAHVRQLQTVMNALSQSGIGANMINLSRHGVKADEHTAVNFSFSRNDETGDVTIRYSSPESLPFAFEWTATVNIDGNITTTPMRFTDETTLSREISDAAGKLKQMHITKGREGERDNAVDALLAKVKADSDLMALLAANDASAAEYILMDPNGGLRPEAEAAKRLEALRDNLNELRTAAKGDKRVFDSGLKQLALFSGKALKSGIIAKMCEMTGKEDIGAFRGISAASSPEKVFEAMCRLESMVIKVCAETKVMKTFNGAFGAEGSSVNSLILGLFFGRCDEQTLNGLKNAMYSANSGKMKYLLDQLKDGEFPPGTRLERPVRVASSKVADSLGGMFRRDMTAVLNNTLGIEEFDPPAEPEDNETIDRQSQDKMLEILVDHTRNTHPDIIAKAEQAAKKPIVFQEL